MTPAADDEVIRTAVAAKIIGVSKATVIRYAREGLLPCRVIPSGHRRFLRSDVEQLRDNPPVKKWARSIASRPTEGDAA